MKLICATAGALLWALALSGAAEAGERSIIKNAFHEKLNQVECADGGFECRFISDRLPDDRILAVTQVSCYLVFSVPVRAVFLSYADVPNGLNRKSIQFLPTSTFINNDYYHVFTQPVDFTVGPRKFVRVSASTATGMTINGAPDCSITGKLSDR